MDGYFPVFVPATTNDICLLRLAVLYFRLLTSTIPSGPCCVQYSAPFVPALPNDGLFPHLSNRHFLLLTSTVPSKACCVQYSVIFVPTISNVGQLQQPWFVHVVLFLTSTIPSRACCVQESEIFLLSIPKIGILPKPLALHFVLLEKFTVPSFTIRPQHYRVVLNTRVDRQCWRALIPLSVLSSNIGFVDNRVATKVRTYFEMRTDGQRFFV